MNSWRRPVLLLLAALTLLSVVAQLTMAARNAGDYAQEWTYSRVDYWLKEAACARDSGVLLVVCLADGGYGPIEDHSAADDMGHGLLLGLLAKYTSVPLDKTTLVNVNLALNLAGLLALSLALVFGGHLIAAFVFASWSSWIVFTSFMSADVIGAYYGVFAMALVLPVVLAIGARRPGANLRHWLGFTAGLVLLMLAIILRQPIGMVGALTSLIVIGALMVVAWKSMRRMPRLVAGTVMAAAVLMSMQTGSMLVAYRTHVYEVPAGKLNHDHGIAHNLYIGLGTHDNPWGIEWLDANAYAAVQARDPSIAYVSKAYYDTLLELWWEKVRSNPGAAARIYLTKAGEVLAYSPPGQLKIGIWFLAALAVLVAALVRRRRGKAVPDPGWMLYAAVFVFVCGGMMQGVLAVPAATHLFPLGLGMILFWALLIEAALPGLSRRLARFSGAVDTLEPSGSRSPTVPTAGEMNTGRPS